MPEKTIEQINEYKDHNSFTFYEMGTFRKIIFLVKYQNIIIVFKKRDGSVIKMEKNKSEIKNLFIWPSKSVFFDVNIVINFTNNGTATFRSKNIYNAICFASEILNLEFSKHLPYQECNEISSLDEIKPGVINVDLNIKKKIKTKKISRCFFAFSIIFLLASIGAFAWSITTLF